MTLPRNNLVGFVIGSIAQWSRIPTPLGYYGWLAYIYLQTF